MINIFSWKLATGAAGVLSVVLSGMLIVASLENRQIAKHRDELITAIQDPHTGYAARLAQSNTNIATLTEAIKTQNSELDKLSSKSMAMRLHSEQQLALLATENSKLQKSLAKFLDTVPSGNTVCEKLEDVDRRAVEEFLK